MTDLLKAADAMAEALRPFINTLRRMEMECREDGIDPADTPDDYANPAIPDLPAKAWRQADAALSAYEAAKREAEADKTTVLCHNIGLTI